MRKHADGRGDIEEKKAIGGAAWEGRGWTHQVLALISRIRVRAATVVITRPTKDMAAA
jgi:hypothetical protein